MPFQDVFFTPPCPSKMWKSPPSQSAMDNPHSLLWARTFVGQFQYETWQLPNSHWIWDHWISSLLPNNMFSTATLILTLTLAHHLDASTPGAEFSYSGDHGKLITTHCKTKVLANKKIRGNQDHFPQLQQHKYLSRVLTLEPINFVSTNESTIKRH